MSDRAAQLLEDALRLSSLERAAIAERLLSSLDQPDARIDALWVSEVEARISAYEAGQMQAFTADEVFADREEA